MNEHNGDDKSPSRKNATNSRGESSVLFQNSDPTNPEEIVMALSQVDPPVATTIQELITEKAEKETEVQTLRRKLDELQDDLEDCRRRSDNHRGRLEQTIQSDFIKDFLNIRDDLSRALRQDGDDIKDGLRLTLEDFDNLLANHGVAKIEPAGGDDFNPDYHTAMSQVKSDLDSGCVVECHRLGFKLEDSVVRPARVTVSQ